MADLKARFSLIDDMSDKMSQIGESGLNMMEAWEQAGEAASSAIDGVASSATQTATAVDGVAHSIDEINSSAGSAGGAADDLSAALINLDHAMEEASSETDNWTTAAQNYDKSALEMVYTTEELVAMGLKTADALGNVEEMYEMCEAAAGQLNSELENSASVHEALADAIQSAERVMEEFADSGRLSAEASEQLDEANRTVANAMTELETAQNEAKAAMDAYDQTIISGTTDLNELGAAAERAEQAAANLAAANEKASKATEELSQASQGAAESAESSGEQGVKAIEAVAETLVAAKIVEKVEEITEACYELADAYSESQKIIVNATGATGDTLDGLEQSMMNAYSNNKKDLETTAAAIGEINTRMGLQGDALSDMTGKFLDYSNVTNSNVVTSVANVTKVMNKWNEEQENVENVMDKLVYASQISGASVDSLSSSLINGAGAFQQVDLSLDNTISLLSAFELYGLNSSTAIMAMRNAVKHFSDEGENAGAGLRRVIDEIANMESAAEATALACDVFGSRAGIEMANAIRNGAISVEMLNGNLDVAQGSLEKTAQAGETLSEKWEKSNNKIKTAFTSALQPTIDKMSAGLAKVMGGIGDFLNKHPAVTKGLVAITAGVVAATVAIAAIAVSSLTAIPAVAAFGASVQAALGPISWISVGATVLVGGIMALTGAFSESGEEVADYEGTLKQCREEIERTEAAYDKACEMYGENSSAAKALSDNIDTLNAQYQKGGGYLAELSEQAAEAKQTLQELDASIQTQYDDLESMQINGLQAVAMLEALSEKSNLTNSDLDLMQSYADYLNDTFNCNIVVNYDTGELTGFDPTLIAAQVMKQYETAKYQVSIDALSNTEFVDNYITAYKALSAAQEEYNTNYESYKAMYDQWHDAYETSLDTSGEIVTWDDNALKKSEEYRKKVNELQSTLDECQDAFNEYDNTLRVHADIIDSTGTTYEVLSDSMQQGITSFDEFAESVSETTSQTLTYQEAAAYAYESVREEIEDLCKAYNDAYDAAKTSFEGQFGLFDQATTNSEKYMNSTVTNAQAALETQLNYWTEYGNNIEYLKSKSAEDLNLSQRNYELLMSYVQNGSEEAAGLAASMVSEIEKGHVDTVSELGKTLGDVNAKQDEISKSVADWKTNFASEMDAILKKANETVKDLDLSELSEQAAYNTLSSYIYQLKRSGGTAVAEAQSIANRISAALASANAKINVSLTGSVPGHATGTTNAEDVFIAGENGPELIVGKAGSTVFPNSETNKIISALEGVGGNEYTQTSYATSTAMTNNTTANNYSRAVENFDQRETTEINNNYTTIENGSSYDDGRIINLLDSFVAIFSVIEQKMDKQSEIVMPEINVLDAYEKGTTASEDIFIAGEKGPELIVGQPDSYVFPTEETDRIIKAMAAYGAAEPYDFTALEKSLSRDSGDTYSVNNIRNYNTAYGDAISKINNDETSYGDSIDRSYTETVNYGDVVKSFEESVRGGDSNYNAVTSYDNERSYTASADTSYGDTFGSEINYGDVIRNAAEENSNSNDRSYTETVNYGDVVKSFIENVTGGIEQRYNTSNTASNSSEQSYYNSVGEKSYRSEENTNYGNTLDSTISYGDIIRTITENVERKYEEKNNSSNSTFSNRAKSYYNSIGGRTYEESNAYENAVSRYYDGTVGVVTEPTYRSDLSYESDYSRTIRNIDQNETKSSSNNLSNNVQTDNAISNYSNSSENVENAFESASNINKATSLTNSAESHSDSVSVLSEAIKNNSVANNHYERALTNLCNNFDTNTSSVEQATNNVESIANGDIFNNVERNVKSMEQSFANDNRIYETYTTASNIRNADNSSTAAYYSGDSYYDNRDILEAHQNADSRKIEQLTSYGNTIRNFESAYINSENAPETLENGSVSVFIPIIGIISSLLERAFSGDLRAVEANDEVVSQLSAMTEEETTYPIAIPELPVYQDSDNRIVTERGVEKDLNGTEDDRSGRAGTETVKRIVLEVAGSGSIDISNGVDREQVLELLQENLKPVLMNIISNEIYEEGELSYDF